MIFKYNPTLKKVIETGTTVQINPENRIEKLANIETGVKYVSDKEVNGDYYSFMSFDDGRGIVFYSDGDLFDGFTVFETPLDDFYFEVNMNKDMLDLDDGVGNETDFPDLLTGNEIGDLVRAYSIKDDEALKKCPAYLEISKYVGKYLGYSEEEEQRINLAFTKFVMAIYIDQNHVTN